MKTKFLITTMGLTALALTGCTSTENANANLKNVNSNTAVVVNSNQAPITSNNNNSNRRDNSNISREEYDKNKAEYEKNKGNSKIGTGVNDSWLWFKTRAALLAADDLRDSTIDVDVDNDVITLRGTVANAAQKTKAEQVANGIEGKKSVKNELKVAPNDSMTNTKSSSDSTKSTNANTKK
jgi:hypothetical protein